jgi:integrase
VLDGELIVTDERGHPDFEAMMTLRRYPRRVPLPAKARFHLKRYLEEEKEKGTLDLPLLFLFNYQKRISERSVQDMLAKIQYPSTHASSYLWS